jgi:nucleoside-diphosphate-sugar epimerase
VKALITGGAGFIGYHLSRRLLQEGYNVSIIDNLSRGAFDDELRALLNDPDVSFQNIDLLDSGSTKRFSAEYDLIFHLAAIIGVSNVLGKPYRVLSDNVLMLLNLIEIAKKQKSLKRFIFTSTSEVYAGTLQNFELPLPTPESTPLALTSLEHPRTSYMLSKIYGEALLHQSGLPFTIVRPHNVYGPRMGMAHVIPELLNKAHRACDGGSIEVYSVDHSRTFCFIDDFIEMIYIGATTEICKGETLNIGTQSPEIKIGELAKHVTEVTGKNLDIISRPATPGSPARRCPDMTKTRELTGYSSQVDIIEGIRRTYHWYRNNIFDRAPR